MGAVISTLATAVFLFMLFQAFRSRQALLSVAHYSVTDALAVNLSRSEKS